MPYPRGGRAGSGVAPVATGFARTQNGAARDLTLPVPSAKMAAAPQVGRGKHAAPNKDGCRAFHPECPQKTWLLVCVLLRKQIIRMGAWRRETY